MALKKKSHIRKMNIEKKSGDRKGIIKFCIIGLLLVTGVAAWGYMSNESYQKEHDLSRIGKGKVAVVQVSDPNCKPCKRLEGVVNRVKGDFSDVYFKTADLSTEKGKAFADKQGVSFTTLVFFDKLGRKKEVLTGVSTKEQISQQLASMTK